MFYDLNLVIRITSAQRNVVCLGYYSSTLLTAWSAAWVTSYAGHQAIGGYRAEPTQEASLGGCSVLVNTLIKNIGTEFATADMADLGTTPCTYMHGFVGCPHVVVTTCRRMAGMHV